MLAILFIIILLLYYLVINKQRIWFGNVTDCGEEPNRGGSKKERGERGVDVILWTLPRAGNRKLGSGWLLGGTRDDEHGGHALGHFGAHGVPFPGDGDVPDQLKFAKSFPYK